MRVAILTAVSFLLVVPAPLSAQESQQPSDPEADSPSGVVYELPFDRARDDAAPRRRERRGGTGRRGDRGGDGGSGGGGSGGGQADGESGGGGPVPGRDPTSIRSENNFGSSSEVPGVDDGAEETGDEGATGNGTGRDGERGAASGDRAAANDEELGGGEPGAGGAFSPDSTSASTAGSSDSVVISLLGLILIVGAGLGVMAGRARRRSS